MFSMGVCGCYRGCNVIIKRSDLVDTSNRGINSLAAQSSLSLATENKKPDRKKLETLNQTEKIA